MIPPSSTDPTGRAAHACGLSPSTAREDLFYRSRFLDRARDMHVETVRLRLTRIRDNGEAMVLSDILRIVREAFSAGASSLADAQTAMACERDLETLRRILIDDPDADLSHRHPIKVTDRRTGGKEAA